MLIKNSSAAILAAGAFLLGSLPASAVNTDGHQIPYFGVSAQYLMTDSRRNSDDGLGAQLTFGVPLESGRDAIEVRFHDTGYARPLDGKDNFQSALMVNYVRDWGSFTSLGIKPFATAGLGFVQEDVFASKHLHLSLDVGGGLIVPIPFKGWAVRLDAHAQMQANDETCQGAPCTRSASSLTDYLVNLGIQIPMAWFYDKPVAVPAAVEDCPLAVVDPASGRRDCSADSDADGVGDKVDACPDTPRGAAVNRQGCSRSQLNNDLDGDGVANADDECPDTQPGLKVDQRGCVVKQTTALRGVTFETNSDRLTSEGRSTLDGVAATLKGQSDLTAEIAGHTDSLGSDAYNMVLSQRRADSVRSHLVSQGVGEARLTAVGYGELEPVDSNDTNAGRQNNRRVEFRINTK